MRSSAPHRSKRTRKYSASRAVRPMPAKTSTKRSLAAAAARVWRSAPPAAVVRQPAAGEDRQLLAAHQAVQESIAVTPVSMKSRGCSRERRVDRAAVDVGAAHGAIGGPSSIGAAAAVHDPPEHGRRHTEAERFADQARPWCRYVEPRVPS